MDYGIISRIDLKEAHDLSMKIIDFMRKAEDIIVEKTTAEYLNIADSVRTSSLEDMNVEILITVGGDGTILRALQKNDAAIFAVNMGKVGFLTEVSGNNVEEYLGRLIDEDFTIEERSKLRTLVNREKYLDGVNEAVIHTSQISKIREFNIYIDGILTEKIRADGLIIATPTGSTCYAMSVGAPIIDPRVPAHVIVPIAPYKLSTRPIVIPAKSEVEIRETNGRETILVVDGQHEEKLKEDVLTFTLSPKSARFVRFDENFYERIREKFLR